MDRYYSQRYEDNGVFAQIVYDMGLRWLSNKKYELRLSNEAEAGAYSVSQEKSKIFMIGAALCVIAVVVGLVLIKKTKG